MPVALLLADFGSLVPSGERAEGRSDDAIWNVEMAGHFDPDHALQCDARQSLHYHLDGSPRTTAEIVEQALPLSRESLLGHDPHDPEV